MPFTKKPVYIEATAIVPSLQWKVMFHTKWKTNDKSGFIHLSAAVLAMVYVKRQGHKDGFAFLATSKENLDPLIRKGRHSDRALHISLQKLSAFPLIEIFIFYLL